MNRETHVRFCEGLGCNSLGLLTYGRSRRTAQGQEATVAGWLGIDGGKSCQEPSLSDANSRPQRRHSFMWS